MLRDSEKHEFGFNIETDGTLHYFDCESELLKKQWVVALSKKVAEKEEELGAISFDDRDVLSGLRSVYFPHLKQLEEDYIFSDFHHRALKPIDFSASPMVLLIGQYSVGKTTFIKHMIKRKIPGEHIGPEPTTDKFMAVMHGDDGMFLVCVNSRSCVAWCDCFCARYEAVSEFSFFW